jgi:hypothetical protein
MDPRSESRGQSQSPRFRFDRLEERIAPAIVLVNPGGNTPQGGGANNGQAIEAQNPAGHAPPGQNP